MLKKYWFLFVLVAAINCTKPTVNNNPQPPPPPPPVTSDSTFTNPLLSSGPDPWVFQKDSMYYYTNTSGDRIRLWRTTKMSKLANAEVKNIWIKP
ncbi:MAG TPA: hypothetical protein VM888_06880, partial [Chitinophagaceae bacterium]|nr:hypothetical protein [Chitinophagaceae bacterium]